MTLGGAGKKNVDRHPKIGNGVLIGAGATLLGIIPFDNCTSAHTAKLIDIFLTGNITIGDGSNIGARSMVSNDVPPNCVVVGVPARIIYQLRPSSGFPSRFTRGLGVEKFTNKDRDDNESKNNSQKQADDDYFASLDFVI